MKKSICCFALFFFFHNFLIAQTYLNGLSARWDDSFVEWEVYALDNEEEIEGELRLKWPFRNNWSEWVLDLGDQYLTIRLRYKNVSDHWEIRGAEHIVVMKPIWLNDITQWRISVGGKKFKWRTQYPNDLNYWYFEDNHHGYAELYTVYRDDPRDWEFNDQTIDIPLEATIAMVFIGMYYSTPKL